MTKLTFPCFFTNKYFFYIKAKLTVSKSLSSTWRYFFDSTHLKGCHFFSSIFQPKGKSQDLVEPCFPYTFYPSFMPPICSGGYSSFNLNHFLACCELLVILGLNLKDFRLSDCYQFQTLEMELIPKTWNTPFFFISIDRYVLLRHPSF